MSLYSVTKILAGFSLILIIIISTITIWLDMSYPLSKNINGYHSMTLMDILMDIHGSYPINEEITYNYRISEYIYIYLGSYLILVSMIIHEYIHTFLIYPHKKLRISMGQFSIGRAISPWNPWNFDPPGLDQPQVLSIVGDVSGRLEKVSGQIAGMGIKEPGRAVDSAGW